FGGACMATVQQIAAEPRFVLNGVSWETYVALRDIEANWHVRMTYDRGTLEMKVNSDRHENMKKLIGRLIEAFTAELNIPLRSFGETTWRRREIDKGLEADECYYIVNQTLVSRRVEVDLLRDPPPDLALEVVVSHGDVDKMAIYAALGVPEVWHWEDDNLQAYALEQGRYVPRETSVNLPILRVKDLDEFLDPGQALDESAWINAFRAWARERFDAQ
ncbi:MAG: Uma2 family endonuclease, partial [Pirellulales bacterium]